MITSNLDTSGAWAEILNPFSISNASNTEVEVWIGTVTPLATSIGHLLNRGEGLTLDMFDAGDRLWVRTRVGTGTVTVTSRA